MGYFGFICIRFQSCKSFALLTVSKRYSIHQLTHFSYIQPFKSTCVILISDALREEFPLLKHQYFYSYSMRRKHNKFPYHRKRIKKNTYALSCQCTRKKHTNLTVFWIYFLSFCNYRHHICTNHSIIYRHILPLCPHFHTCMNNTVSLDVFIDSSFVFLSITATTAQC